MFVCRLCGLAGKLVKAHIIPEAFFRPLRASGESPQLLTDTPGHFAKNSPIGVYDSEILCRACEDRFQSLDDYGIGILLTNFDRLFVPLVANGRVAAFQASGIDQAAVLRCLVSVLWRASVSKQRFFFRVDLGPYLDAARQVLDATQPISPVFAAVLTRWSHTVDNEHVVQTIMSPYRERFLGKVNGYRLYFGKVVAHVKVDSSSFPLALQRVALMSDLELTVGVRTLENSKEEKAMINVMRKSDSNSALAKQRGYWRTRLR